MIESEKQVLHDGEHIAIRTDYLEMSSSRTACDQGRSGFGSSVAKADELLGFFLNPSAD